MPERRRLAALAALALIALGAWRLVTVVAASPMLGYANQFDMRRTSACVGLWPAVPAGERLQAHPQAPIARYVRGEKRPDECYLSSELAFVSAAGAVASMGTGWLDLRVVGAIEAIALVVAALALHAVFSRRTPLALAHALVFALVICDPLNSLWLNTLYTEFSALFFAYVSIGLLIAIAAPDTSRFAPGTVIAVFALSLVGLGLSRQQHFFLPALIALPAVLSLWRSARVSALSLVAVVSVVALLQLAVIERHPTIVAANNVDVVLGAILPASRDASRTAERLGLPARCLQSVGATWYNAMGESLEVSCPEALSISRARVAAVAIGEPSTSLRALLRGLPQLQDWRLGYLGAVEGGWFAGSEAVRAEAGVAAASVAPWVTAVEPRAFSLLLACAFALFVVSAAVCIASTLRARADPLSLVLYALTGSAGYAIATAIFGDGYVEVSRHAQLAAPCLCAAAVVIAASLLAPLVFPSPPSRRAAVSAAIHAAAALGIGGLLWLAMGVWMREAPMAIGVVDRPESNRVPVAPLQFTGWALEPSGVARVELVTRVGAVIPAHYGLPYVGAKGEALRLYFPAYPDVDAAGFAATLPADAPADGTLDVRTVVVGRSGTRTEVDRRLILTERR